MDTVYCKHVYDYDYVAPIPTSVEWDDEDENRYRKSRPQVHAFARKVITSELDTNSENEDPESEDTDKKYNETNHCPNTIRKSGNVCQLEHLSGATFQRGSNQSSHRSPNIHESRSADHLRRTNQLTIENPTNDDVFEPHDPNQESIFVYSNKGPQKPGRKPHKNLLKFKEFIT